MVARAWSTAHGTIDPAAFRRFATSALSTSLRNDGLNDRHERGEFLQTICKIVRLGIPNPLCTELSTDFFVVARYAGRVFDPLKKQT